MKHYMKHIIVILIFNTLLFSYDEIFSSEEYPEGYCLAQNIYFEARGSSFADQIAVADVVINRTKDNRYPNTICKVVKQARLWKGNPIRNQCQYSWFCDGESDKPTDKQAWINAQYIAYKMLEHNEFLGITEGATHYHATYVHPYWVKDFQLIGQIGSHIFYRWNKQ